MLYQMLTGQLPFSGASAMEVALARLYEAPRDPLARRPNLPPALVEVLKRCLAIEPEDRFQTADELLAALGTEASGGRDLAAYLGERQTTSQRGSAAAPRHPRKLDPGTVSDDDGTIQRSPATPLLPLLQSEPGTRQLAVAVLLFRLRGEPGDEYLAQSLTEEIIDRLSESERLLVTSFGVVSALKSELRDPAELGPRLHVHVIVDGTLRLLPNGLAVTIRLVEVERGLQYAVRRLERPDRNVLLLAHEVTKVIGTLLTIQFDQNPGDMIGDPVAVDLYLRGRHQYHALHAEAAAESVALFEQAVARLPADPVLLTGYALALARHWFFGGEGAAARATEAAERAMAVAPERGESLLAQATVYFNGNRIVESARSLRTALPRAPRLAEAHELVGMLLTEAGSQYFGQRHLNYALMLDNTVPRVRMAMAQALALQGHLENALATLFWPGCDPTFAVVRWVAVARILSWFKDAERARAYLEDPALAAPEHRMNRRRMAFIAGERMLTREEYIPFHNQSPFASPRSHLFGLQLAIEYHLLLEQIAEARAALCQIADYRLGDIHWLESCPLLAPLRATPEYVAVHTASSEFAKRVQRAFGLSPT